MIMERMTRRRFLAKTAALAGGLGILGLGAQCGAPAPTPTAAPKATVAPKAEVTPPAKVTVPAKKEQVNLRLQSEAGTRGEKNHEWGKKRLEEKYPYITVKVEDITYGEIAMKTDMLAATKDLQDVLLCHNRWFWPGSYKGYHLALDDMLKANPDLPGWVDQYDVVKEIVKFEGKTTGICENITPGAESLFTWNREIIKAAGAKMPEPAMGIWDFQEIAFKCANKEKGIFGMETPIGTQARMESWLRCWGKPQYGVKGDTSGWITSPDGKKFRWYDNPAADEWYNKYFRPMLDARAYPKAADTVEGGLFAAGLCAILTGYEATLARFVKQITKWKFYPEDYVFRKGREGRYGTSTEVKMRCVSSQTKHPQEALILAAWMCSTEAGIWDIMVQGSGRAGTKGAFADPKVQAQFPVYKEMHRLLTEGIAEPYPIPWNLRDQEFTDTWVNLSTPLLQGEKNWQEQAPVIQKEIQKLFDQPRP